MLLLFTLKIFKNEIPLLSLGQSIFSKEYICERYVYPIKTQTDASLFNNTE